MQTDKAPYKVSILADGRYVIQNTDPKDQHIAFSDQYGSNWVLLFGSLPGYGPTFYDPNLPSDMDRLKANLKRLIQRDEEHKRWVHKTTPVDSISAEEFLKLEQNKV